MTQYYVKKGGRYVEANPFSDVDISVMIISAVRETMGSGSYSPGCAMDWCKANWLDLTKNARHVIMRDVMEWLGQRHEWNAPGTTDTAWPDDWRKFLTWCFAQDADESKSAARANAWKRDNLQGVDEFFEVLK